MGSLAGSLWPSEKTMGRRSLEAPKTRGRLLPAGYRLGRLAEGGPAINNLWGMPQQGRLQESRPIKDRLQESRPMAGGHGRYPIVNPHNSDKTGHGYSGPCHTRIPEQAWLQYAEHGGHPLSGEAL